MMNQNKNYALTLDHLWTINVKKEALRRINRYFKKKDIETIVVSPPQSYAHHDINEINIDIMKKKNEFSLIIVE